MASVNFDFFELKEEYKNPDSIKAMIANEKEENRTKYEQLYADNPEEFAHLYQVKNNIHLQENESVVIGLVDDKMALLFSDKKEGEENFYITAMKKNENGSIGGSIYVKDEQANKMGAENMKNLVETVKDSGIDVSTLTSENANLSRLLDEISEMLGRGEVNPLVMEDLLKRGGKLTGSAAVDFADAVKVMEESIRKNMNKSIGKECLFSHKKGYAVFELYGMDLNNRSKKEKENGGVVPDARIYVRNNGNNPPSFKYHVKNNGGINDQIADTMADAIKDSGCDSADISKVVNCDRGKFMDALAKKGLVPMGIYINPVKAQGLIKLASDKLPSEKLKKFKIQLALSMEEYNIKNGKDSADDNGFIASIKSEYRNSALKEAWDLGGLKGALADKTRTSDQAEETLGAIYAMTKVLNAYKDFDSIGALLAFPVGAKTQKSPNIVIFDNQEEKNKIAALFAGREDMSIQDLSATDMKLMFNRFMEYGRKHAEKSLLDVYEKNEREYTARQFDRTIILSLYNQMKNMLTSTTEELKANGCEISLPTMNQPDTYKKGQEHARRIKAELDAKKEKEKAEKEAKNKENSGENPAQVQNSNARPISRGGRV